MNFFNVAGWLPCTPAELAEERRREHVATWVGNICFVIYLGLVVYISRKKIRKLYRILLIIGATLLLLLSIALLLFYQMGAALLCTR